MGADRADSPTNIFARLRSSRRTSYMMSGWFENVALPKGGGGTTAITIGCPDDFVAVRLGFPNMTDRPWLIKKIIGCASSTYNDYVNPTGSKSWVPFTFASGGADNDFIASESGAPTEITVAAGKRLPTWTWTDWTPLASVAPQRSDGLRVLMLRALIPSEQTVCYAVGQMRTLLGNKAINSGFDYFVGGIKFDTDRVNQIIGREPTIAWIDNQLTVGSLFPMVQFLTRKGGFSGVVTGDSHQQGTSTTEQFSNFFYRAVTRQIAKNPGAQPLGMVNCAAGGLTSLEFFERMAKLLNPVRPSYAILPGWTYNDRSGDIHADQAAMNVFFARLMAAAEQCSSLGILPVFTTPFPRDGGKMGPTQLAPWRWLRQSLLDLRQTGEIVFDTSLSLGNQENGQFDGTYLRPLTDDQAHPSDIGHATVAEMLSPFFQRLNGF